jgi:hypothetical protein
MESCSNGIVRIESGDWPLLKAIRLRALGESPDAFGTPLAVEEKQTDQFWKDRASNEQVATFVVVDKGAFSSSAAVGERRVDECLGLITGAPCFHRDSAPGEHGERAAGLYSM